MATRSRRSHRVKDASSSSGSRKSTPCTSPPSDETTFAAAGAHARVAADDEHPLAVVAEAILHDTPPGPARVRPTTDTTYGRVTFQGDVGHLPTASRRLTDVSGKAAPAEPIVRSSQLCWRKAHERSSNHPLHSNRPKTPRIPQGVAIRAGRSVVMGWFVRGSAWIPHQGVVLRCGARLPGICPP